MPNPIQEKLDARGESMGKFCARVGISRNTLKRVMRGQPTNQTTQAAVARGLGLSHKALLSLTKSYYGSNNKEVPQQ